MATILCLETATTNCSVALSVNGSVIAFKEDRSSDYTHAEKLHPFIEDVLSDANLPMSGLDAIAVSKGPGSYTGLRIGVSAAKGLCFAQDIPLISVLTLRSMVNPIKVKSDFKIPMLDARRMEVYAAVFNSNNNEVRETRAEILTEDSFSEYLDQGKVIFFGSGIAKFQKLVDHPNAVFVPDVMPSSIDMADIAEDKYNKNDIEDVAYFEPYYLKDFISG